jgi:hypothetical protein
MTVFLGLVFEHEVRTRRTAEPPPRMRFNDRHATLLQFSGGAARNFGKASASWHLAELQPLLLVLHERPGSGCVRWGRFIRLLLIAEEPTDGTSKFRIYVDNRAYFMRPSCVSSRALPNCFDFDLQPRIALCDFVAGLETNAARAWRHDNGCAVSLNACSVGASIVP